MTCEFRILRSLVEKIHADLDREHQFAYERVGFIHCKSEVGGKLILAEQYLPIEDAYYIQDEFVGARFSGKVIEKELNHSIKSTSGVFHVHKHEHTGEPNLSSVDIRSISEICFSLSSVNPTSSHGCLLFSEDRLKAYKYSRKTERLIPLDLVVVGFPILLSSYGGTKNERKI